MSDYKQDFNRGARDCQNGVEHKSGDSSAYDRGYSAQYEQEQIAGANHEK